MKILYIYCINELLKPLLLGILIFSFLFLSGQIGEIVELIVQKGVPVKYGIMLLVYYMPATFAITIPMGLLMGILISFGRLSGDNEINAIKASGINLLKIMMPVFAVAMLITFLLIMFNNTLLPSANNKFRNLYFSIGQKKPIVKIDQNIFLEIDDKTLFIERISKDKKFMENIYIKETDKDKGTRQVIFAKQAEWFSYSSMIKLDLRDGTIHYTDPEKPEKYNIINFSTHTISFSLGDSLSMQTLEKGLREMTAGEILAKIKEKAGAFKKHDISLNEFYIEYYKKFSIPFACLAFAAIGIPLGLITRRGDKSIGFGLSLLLIFLYYILLIAGETMSGKSGLSPFLAMWLPNFILLAVGALLAFFVLRK